MDVPKFTQYGIWLRCPTSAGGKDWRGFVTTTKVISQWGKTNFINQEKVLFDQPSHNNLARKANEKANKGYKVIGHYHVDSQTWVMAGQAPPVNPPLPSRPIPTPPAPPSQPDRVLSEWVAAGQGDEETWF